MRIIIRRPQAYTLKAREPVIPIPGLHMTLKDGKRREIWDFAGKTGMDVELLLEAMHRAAQ